MHANPNLTSDLKSTKKINLSHHLPYFNIFTSFQFINISKY